MAVHLSAPEGPVAGAPSPGVPGAWDVGVLDVHAALRADLAARAAGGAPGPGGAVGHGSAPDGQVPNGHVSDGGGGPGAEEAVRVAAWLPLVLGLDRAARLPGSERAAHFRRQRPAWEAAAEAGGDERYARVGARLARWRTADPRLPLVKELLWALEQPEAAGYVRLALAGVTALGALVPPDDVRAGYVLAQSARAVRTLGDTHGAVQRYRIAERLGDRLRDRWLRVRSAIGLAATYHHLGNYPAARGVCRAILSEPQPDPRFAAVAHHGLVLSAIPAKDWDTALAHGWHLLQAARRGQAPRIDALLLMGSVCRDIGRYAAAASAATAALALCERPDDFVFTHKLLVDVALRAGDANAVRTHAAALRAHLWRGAGPYEDARALLTLAEVACRAGEQVEAREHAEAALGLARRHSHHEVEFEAEAFLTSLTQRSADAEEPTADGCAQEGEHVSGSVGDGEVTLERGSERIVARVARLPSSSGWLAGAA